MKTLSIILIICILIFGITLYNQNKEIKSLQFQINTFQDDRVKADDNLLNSIGDINDDIGNIKLKLSLY